MVKKKIINEFVYGSVYFGSLLKYPQCIRCCGNFAKWRIFLLSCAHYPRGGGGVSLPYWRPYNIPDARESASANHPKRGFNGRLKYILNRSHGPTST